MAHRKKSNTRKSINEILKEIALNIEAIVVATATILFMVFVMMLILWPIHAVTHQLSKMFKKKE